LEGFQSHDLVISTKVAHNEQLVKPVALSLVRQLEAYLTAFMHEAAGEGWRM
jgi:hypothetical protein